MPLMLMDHEGDPREEVVTRIGDVSGFRISANQVLVGIYERPQRTKSGVYIPEKNRDEDRYQGKVGLILKMGPMAFKDSDNYKFDPADVRSIGDWVIFKASDGWPVIFNTDKGHCRILEDTDIRGTTDQPDKVF